MIDKLRFAGAIGAHPILTSGYLSPDAAKTMMNGSVEFIPKPLDAAALIAIIQRLIATRFDTRPLDDRRSETRELRYRLPKAGLTELARCGTPKRQRNTAEVTGAANPQLTARGRAPDLTGIGER